jgi:adenosylcobinamide-phosphate synthase
LSLAAALILAMILDALLGEPKWLWNRVPHPAILMGRAVGWADARFNRATHRRLKGVAALAGLVLGAGLLGLALAAIPTRIADILVAAFLLAQRSLADHVGAVATGLQQSLTAGRKAVAMIVSRDSAVLDAPAVARSAIESAAENLSDGVIAPAFWFLIGGLPGLLIYKITNTADSMIGYRTPRHLQFGWAAARFDDLLNLVPARLTALLIWATAPRRGQFLAIREDAALHRSPNAGWPEAAMARRLGIALAGPRSYDGEMRDFPFVNDSGAHDIGPETIRAATQVLWQAWAMALVVIAITLLI